MATRLVASFSAEMAWRALSSGVPRGNHDARDLSAGSDGREQNETEKPAFHAAPPDCAEIVAPLRAGGKQKNNGTLDAYILIPQFWVLPDELFHHADTFVALHHFKRNAA